MNRSPRSRPALPALLAFSAVVLAVTAAFAPGTARGPSPPPASRISEWVARLLEELARGCRA